MELVSLLSRASDRARLEEAIKVLLADGVRAVPVLAGRGRTAEFALVSLPLLAVVRDRIEKVQAPELAASRLEHSADGDGVIQLTLEELAVVAGAEPSPEGERGKPVGGAPLDGEP
ncbi:hypothetical protein [Spirillospora sp. CA-128828]|uniref:hypothetical protein n=1 Tax=Spirillospora sp. CA-128828 TaxID=3240033 RepID=UPI003D8F072F